MYSIPFGVADIKRAGSDLTIIATAETIHKSLRVAERLQNEGFSIEVVDPRTVVPLDIETLVL